MSYSRMHSHEHKIPRAPTSAGAVRKSSTSALKWRDGGGGGSDPEPAAGVQQSIAGPFSCWGCPAPLSLALSSLCVGAACVCPAGRQPRCGTAVTAPVSPSGALAAASLHRCVCVCVRLPPAPPAPLPDATATRVRSRGTLQTPSTSPPRAALTTMRSSALSSRSQPTTT
jgi:hypothetical protein